MKIGIIGTGVMGQSLAKAFASENHQVMFGTRDVSKPEVISFQSKNPTITIGTFAETAKFGELLILTVSGDVAESAVQLAGIENFRGKTVIDTTNPIAKGKPENGVLRFFTDINFSLMEKLQQLIPDAHFVKCFNSIGNNVVYKPSYKQGPPSMFICGNNEGAKKTVADILTVFGWEAEDMGMAEAARSIESLCVLWCIPGFLHNQWGHAFKLLKE